MEPVITIVMKDDYSFQFLGIPPKGELLLELPAAMLEAYDCFQFLGIPPKGELEVV